MIVQKNCMIHALQEQGGLKFVVDFVRSYGCGGTAAPKVRIELYGYVQL